MSAIVTATIVDDALVLLRTDTVEETRPVRLEKLVADAHGWSVTASDGRDGGLRVEVTGVSTLETDTRDL